MEKPLCGVSKVHHRQWTEAKYIQAEITGIPCKDEEKMHKM